jgi:hypothetical protein
VIAGASLLLLPPNSMIGNPFVGYDAYTRHINALNMTMKLDVPLRGAIRLKQYSYRTEET